MKLPFLLSVSMENMDLALSYLISLCFVFFSIPCRVMLVGWGGNNGSTLTAGVIANREYVSVFSWFIDLCLIPSLFKVFMR